MTNLTADRIKAAKIVDELLADMSDRRDFRNAYFNIDDDVKDEWRNTWIDKVVAALELAEQKPEEDTRCTNQEVEEALYGKKPVAVPDKETQDEADLTAAYMAGFERGKDAAINYYKTLINEALDALRHHKELWWYEGKRGKNMDDQDALISKLNAAINGEGE